MIATELDAALENLREQQPAAPDELIGLAYGELHRMARARMRNERPNHTLSATALVNETYLRLFRCESAWDSRAHFFGAAAEAMRRVLIDHARKRGSDKRGAGAERVTLTDLNVDGDESVDIDVLELDRALSALEAHDERLSLVVKLRYFVDLNIEETADVLGVSPATVKRDWVYARAWLFEKMSS